MCYDVVQVVHQLAARAVIQDWEDGYLATHRDKHEIMKKKRKNYIIELSVKFSIVTQFTSFIAVEKRDEDEEAAAWPHMPQLEEIMSAVADVDVLPYIGWTQEDSAERTSSQQQLKVTICSFTACALK